MAQCIVCKKKGVFLKVDSMGYCSTCSGIKLLREEESRYNATLLSIAAQIDGKKEEVRKLDETLSEKEKHLNLLKEQAKEMALREAADKLSELSNKANALARELEVKSDTLSETQEDIEKAEKGLKLASNKAVKVKNLYKSMEYAIQRYSGASKEQLSFMIPGTVASLEEQLSPTVPLKYHAMDIKELRKRFNLINKQIDELLIKYRARYTTKANASIYGLMVIALRSELQNIMYNLKYGKLSSAKLDVKNIIDKYLKIAADGNQSIAPTLVQFIGEIEFLFLETVEIEYEYYSKKERIKEEQRAIREQMRQEAAERKELEKQKKQIEREEGKYLTEIESLEDQMKREQNDIELQKLQTRILELQEQLGEVIKKKDDIVRLQNGQAGYVYIISNFGSFGENIFKIGMTRRLEPQDRVNELGSASVPFPYDVHSFIFSNNAVQLEGDLHKKLNEKRLNKVNRRKEFFITTIDDLERLVEEVEPSAEFKRTMIAEQYNQSQSIDQVGEFDINDLYLNDEDLDES